MAQTDEQIARLIALFRTPPGFDWEPLRDDILTVLKERPSIDQMKLSPIHIQFMLACHCFPDPKTKIGLSQWDSEVGIEVRDWLLANDLVDAEYRSTERGKAWVEFICATPLPEASWRLPARAGAAAA